MGVGQVELRGLDIGLVELHRAFVLLDRERLVGRLLRGDRIFRHKLLISREIGLRFLENGLIVRELSLSLVERRLVGTRIDEKEGIAFFHRLALVKEGLHDLAVHPRLDGDCFDRRDRAERIDRDGDVLERDLASLDAEPADR